MELTIKRVGSDCRALALIFGQGAPAWPRPQRLSPHEPLDAMKAAIDPIRQHVSPYATSAVGAIRANEARTHQSADLLIIPSALAGTARQPGVDPGTGDIQRFAQPW